MASTCKTHGSTIFRFCPKCSKESKRRSSRKYYENKTTKKRKVKYIVNVIKRLVERYKQET